MSKLTRRDVLTGSSVAIFVTLTGTANASPNWDLMPPLPTPPAQPSRRPSARSAEPAVQRQVTPEPDTIGRGGWPWDNIGGGLPQDWAGMYGPMNAGRFPVLGIDISRIEPQFLRQDVLYMGREPAGTIVVDPRQRFLFHVHQGGRATRYGVGVGRQGFSWSGEATVNSKQEWPDWYPPQEMIDRDPSIRAQLTQLQSGLGVAGGLRNPLGARALYLWQGGRDTLYRIHGTLEPYTIGRNVSSGCIRMINQDAMHLYDRVPVGTRVVVLG